MILTSYSPVDVLLLVLFSLCWVWIEYYKWTNKGRIVRSISFLLLLISLMGILFRPHFRQKIQVSKGIVIGENADSFIVDSLKKVDLPIISKNQIPYFEEILTVGEIPTNLISDYYGKITPLIERQIEGFLKPTIPLLTEYEISEIFIPWQGRDSIRICLLFQSDTIELTRISGTKQYKGTIHPQWHGYSILEFFALDRSDTLAVERYPVYIRKHSPWKMQFVTDQPNVELRTLVDWLSNQGHYIEVDYHLRNDFIKQVIFNKNNSEAESFTHIVWDGWPINTIIDDKKTRIFQLSWPDTIRASSNNQVDSLTWQGPKTNTLWHSYTKLKRNWKVPTYTDTYRWRLSGDTLRYAKYWQAFFKNEKPEVSPDLEAIIPQIHWENEPLKIHVYGSNVPTDILIDSINWPYRQMFLPSWGQEMMYWPGAGWHDIQMSDTTVRFFTQKTNKWPAYRQYLVSRSLNTLAQMKYEKTPAKYQYFPFPSYVWLVLFTIACALIWIEQRWNS